MTPGMPDNNSPEWIYVSKLDKKFKLDRQALARGNPEDSPLQRYRAMLLIQSIMCMGDLDLVEIRVHRPYCIDRDAVPTGGRGVINTVSLIFESKI